MNRHDGVEHHEVRPASTRLLVVRRDSLQQHCAVTHEFLGLAILRDGISSQTGSEFQVAQHTGQLAAQAMPSHHPSSRSASGTVMGTRIE